MSRLVVDVTNKQHQFIKTMAAMKGQSIKDYVIDKVLDGSNDEDLALSELSALLDDRVKNAKKNGPSSKSVKQITEDALKKLNDK